MAVILDDNILLISLDALYNLAQCCKPEYPDLIAGYVTRTKGVSIHRADCLIYQRIPHKEDRSVEVAWDVQSPSS